MQITGYKCDVCKEKVKTEKNHWFLAWVRNSPDGLIVIFQAWNEHNVNGSDHICGYECLAKWVGRRAEEINK